jgi:hypothetical protein
MHFAQQEGIVAAQHDYREESAAPASQFDEAPTGLHTQQPAEPVLRLDDPKAVRLRLTLKESGRDDRGGLPHSRSPSAARRNASRARSSAALAAYRPTISRDRQPARRMRSCSWPPLASQVCA